MRHANVSIHKFVVGSVDIVRACVWRAHEKQKLLNITFAHFFSARIIATRSSVNSERMKSKNLK